MINTGVACLTHLMLKNTIYNGRLHNHIKISIEEFRKMFYIFILSAISNFEVEKNLHLTPQTYPEFKTKLLTLSLSSG